MCPVCDDAGIVIARPATEPTTFGLVNDCPRCVNGMATIQIERIA